MNTDIIRVARTRDVKLPCRKTPGAAGIDFYMPAIDERLIGDILAKPQNSAITFGAERPVKSLCVPPMSQALIPSGILYEIPEGFALVAHNKSGVSTKKTLTFLADLGDEDYQGELHLSVWNLGNRNIFFEPGDPVVQFVLTPIAKYPVEETSPDSVFTRGVSSRGAGGFGSTGA